MGCNQSGQRRPKDHTANECPGYGHDEHYGCHGAEAQPCHGSPNHHHHHHDHSLDRPNPSQNNNNNNTTTSVMGTDGKVRTHTVRDHDNGQPPAYGQPPMYDRATI